MKPTPTKPKAKQAKPQKRSTQPKPLNIRQERFAEFVASGMPDSQAYIEAGYTKSRTNAETNAWRVRDHEGVKARIQELRARTSAKFEMKRETLAQYLFAAVMTPIGEIDQNSAFASEMTEDIVGGGNRGKLKRGKAPSGNEVVEESVLRRRVKMIGKIEAGRLLCEMMGWKEPEQHVIEAGPKTLDAVRERAREMAAPLGRVINLKP